MSGAGPSEELLDRAVARLRAGELVVIPTETVYGLAADAANPEAVRRIFALKGRPADRPLIVHLADASALDDWAVAVPDVARRLAGALWPGPLTLVLKRHPRVPDAVTGGQDTVGVRVPDHPLTLELLARFGGGVAAPSANRYQRISPTTPEHVRRQFGDRTPLILDGGPCRVGIESTILDCTGRRPRILRPGRIGAAAIEAVLGQPLEDAGETAAAAAPRAPGQDRTHYAPSVPTRLCARAELPSRRDEARGGRIGFLGFAPPPFPVTLDLRLPAEPEGAAVALYAALHRLDQAGVDLILIERPPADPAWAAVLDRLRRAGGS